MRVTSLFATGNEMLELTYLQAKVVIGVYARTIGFPLVEYRTISAISSRSTTGCVLGFSTRTLSTVVTCKQFLPFSLRRGIPVLYPKRFFSSLIRLLRLHWTSVIAKQVVMSRSGFGR